jgi:hypothetical protein
VLYSIYAGTPTSLIFGQDSDMGMLKDCNTVAHELVPIVTNSNIHQFHSALPEMLDNCPDMQQYELSDELSPTQSDQMMLPPPMELLQSQPPPPSQINVLTGVYTLQEEPEELEIEENTTI